MTLRGLLYRLARLLGDLQALRTGGAWDGGGQEGTGRAVKRGSVSGDRSSALRTREGPMGDLQERDLTFGENRTPDFRWLIRRDAELLDEQADNSFERDPLGREVDSFKGHVIGEAMLCQRSPNLKMHRGVGRRRFSKIVIPEYPAVWLSIELVLKARRLDLCASAFWAVLEKQDHHEP